MIALLNSIHRDEGTDHQIPLSEHAYQRMHARRISCRLVDLTIAYGRVSHVRGATLYAVGEKEIGNARKQGIDLQTCNGLHVTCAKDGTVITVYRNHSLKDLKPHSRFETFNRSKKQLRQRRLPQAQQEMMAAAIAIRAVQ
mgnify:CR=1 FL=1